MKKKGEKALIGENVEVNGINNVQIINLDKNKIRITKTYNKETAELKIFVELK